MIAESEQGDTVLARPNMAALLRAQCAFAGAAAQANLETEGDLDALVADVRHTRNHANDQVTWLTQAPGITA